MSDQPPLTRALLAAIRLSDQPLVLTDPRQADHPMIAVSTAFEALSGYTAAESVGRNCRFLQGPDTDPATPRRIRRCVDDGRGCIEWIVNHRRDGTTFWNLLFISPVFDQDGTLLHFIGNQRDISDARSTEVPDHVMGMADMPLQGQGEFHDALQALLHNEEASDDAKRAKRLARALEAVRRVNEVTLSLQPAPWTLPR